MRIDAYVYVRVSPEVAHRRIIRRAETLGRHSESSISVEYIQRLHDLYEAHIARLVRERGPDSVIIIDNDTDESVDGTPEGTYLERAHLLMSQGGFAPLHPPT